MTDKQTAAAKPRTIDRRVKIGFLAVVLVGAALVYVLQRRTPGFNWPGNLDKALKQARDQKRRVLVFFTASPKSDTSRRIIQETLRKNAAAMAKARVIKVNISLDTELKTGPAVRYKISSLPTFVLLSPDGKELNRREGFVGEVDFRNGFLDCGKVVKPKQ